MKSKLLSYLIVCTIILMAPVQLAKDRPDLISPAVTAYINQRIEDSKINLRSKQIDKEVSRGYRKVYMNVSAYTISDCGMNGKGRTATGTQARSWLNNTGTAAVDPKVIPYGTKLYIPYFKDRPNKGIFIAEDTGGAIKGLKLDLCAPNYNKAIEFGRRELEVHILLE